MLADLQGIIEMVGGFASDMFQADIDLAKVQLNTAKAELARLEKRQAAVRNLLVKYRISLDKQKKSQEEWQRAMRKRAKMQPYSPFPVGVTANFVDPAAQPPKRAKRKNKSGVARGPVATAG